MRLSFLFESGFWTVKEFKNQMMHITGAILISLIIYFIFKDIPSCFIGVFSFALGMEVDHYFKNPSLQKFADCIRDFCFYLLGFFIFWGII